MLLLLLLLRACWTNRHANHARTGMHGPACLLLLQLLMMLLLLACVRARLPGFYSFSHPLHRVGGTSLFDPPFPPTPHGEGRKTFYSGNQVK
jgi:hypothetical protein